MNNLHKDQHGFSIVELTLALVVLILLVGVGGLIYKSHTKSASKNVTSTSTKQEATPTVPPQAYAGWHEFNNSQVSFKYPDGWNVMTPPGANNPSIDYIVVNSPIFTSQDAINAPTYGQNGIASTDQTGSIVVYMQLSTDSINDTCATIGDSVVPGGPCTVQSVLPLASSSLGQSSLVIDSDKLTKNTDFVVVKGSPKLSDTHLPAAAKAGDKYPFYVSGWFQSSAIRNSSHPLINLSDTSHLQNDSHLKDLVYLVDSMKFN